MRDITVKDSTTHSGWLLIVLQMRTDKVVARPPQNNMVLANTACRVIVVASVALNGKRPKTLQKAVQGKPVKKERMTWPKTIQIHFTIFATQVVASQRWPRQVRVNIVFHIVKIEPFFPSGHTGRARIQICGPAWQANMMCDLCPVAFDV